MFGSLLRRLPRVGRVPRLIAAGGCLLLAVASTRHVKKPTADEQRIAVVVAAHDLPAGRALHRADLRLVRWPASLRPAGALDHPGSLTGRRLAGPVRTGEPIGDDRLVGTGLTRGLPVGQVAAPIALDDPHAAEVVRAGDHVTVLATPRAPPDSTVAEPSSASNSIARIAEHALVLAVLPGDADTAGEVVLAVDESTAVRLTRDRPAQMFTIVVDPA